MAGKSIATLEVQASYTDANGTSYTGSYILTFPVRPQPSGGPAATATPTPTATPTATATGTAAPRLRPQLIITGYEVDAGQLEPGTNFELSLTVQNLGSVDARRVTMIVGGGTSGSGVNPEGTPEPGGGLAGAGGSFAEFAPVGSSNVQSLGDLLRGQSLTAVQHLIVNASTKPGAYPLKVSFVYSDDLNGSFVDDQVITLLVYKQPSVAFNFYAPAPVAFAGEPVPLPLQIVNTGSQSAILGTFTVTAENATLENNSAFVGALEPGGYFPLDALLIANEPGTLELQLTIEFTDDFNQPQTITRILTVEVMEGFVFEEPTGPPEDFEEQSPAEEAGPETLLQKIWRALLGLLGLSSSLPQPAQNDFGPPGGEEFMPPEGGEVMPPVEQFGP
jgi:hypothetical protein